MKISEKCTFLTLQGCQIIYEEILILRKIDNHNFFIVQIITVLVF